MPHDNLWTRLRKGRLVQVLLIYLGASWLVLQIGDTLEDALALPGWVLPTAFLLLLVGLVVVTATAWIQSHPVVRERAAAEELPHAWELDPRDLRGAIRERRIPHLTWPRALLGGALAFLLLATVVATVMLVARDGELGSPTRAAASALPGLAVMPFTVSGEGADVWREGMVDLLSTNLDGVVGLRTIDTRNVLARWREVVGDEEADEQLALEAARATGARYALLGSATSLGDRVRLAGDLYDLDTGEKLTGSARTEGARDSLFAVIDRFSVEIVRAALGAEGMSSGHELRGVERLTTSSLPALVAFLEGEAALRRADWRQAIDAYEVAVAADSTFAMAHFRLSHAYGWADYIAAPLTLDAADRAMRHADRLSPRDASLLRLANATTRLGIPDSIERLRALAERYPDDPEIWHELGEAVTHTGEAALMSKNDAVAAFARAIELDSTFSPAYIHAIEFAVQRGDRAETERLLDAYERFSSESIEHLRVLARFFAGPAGASLDSIPTAVLRLAFLSSITTMPDRGNHVARLAEAVAARPGLPGVQRRNPLMMGASASLSAGRPAAAFRFTDAMSPDQRFALRYGAMSDLGVGDPASLREAAQAVPDSTSIDVLLALGAYAVDQNDRGGRDEVVARMRRIAQTLRNSAATASGPGVALAAETHAVGADAIMAYERLRAGDAAGALPVFVRARRGMYGVSVASDRATELVRRWEGDALSRLGRHREAALLYESLPWNSAALLNAARAYGAAGDVERARATWGRLSIAWADAEPSFPLLGELHVGLERTAPDR